MSEELLKIADGLLAVSEGVRALAGKAHSCNCSKNQEEGRGQKDEESGNEKSQEKQENAVTIEQVRAVMASKSQDGKTQQVKALIQKYGADKLSGVQPEKNIRQPFCAICCILKVRKLSVHMKKISMQVCLC